MWLSYLSFRGFLNEIITSCKCKNILCLALSDKNDHITFQHFGYGVQDRKKLWAITSSLSYQIYVTVSQNILMQEMLSNFQKSWIDVTYSGRHYIYIRIANINDNKQTQCASQKFLYTCEMMFTMYGKLKAF